MESAKQKKYTTIQNSNLDLVHSRCNALSWPENLIGLVCDTI